MRSSTLSRVLRRLRARFREVLLVELGVLRPYWSFLVGLWLKLRQLGGVGLAPLALGALGITAYCVRGPVVHRTARSGLGIAWLPAEVAVWTPEIEQAAARHDIDPKLLAIVVLVESGGNPLATSRAGARGLAQLMPSTAVDIAKQRGLPKPSELDLYLPTLNLDFSAYYLAWLLRRYRDHEDQVELAAAAYNGGPGRVSRWLRGKGRLPRETKAYKARVGALYRERNQPDSASLRGR